MHPDIMKLTPKQKQEHVILDRYVAIFHSSLISIMLIDCQRLYHDIVSSFIKHIETSTISVRHAFLEDEFKTLVDSI